MMTRPLLLTCMGISIAILSRAAGAALAVTPPQLHPDDAGIVVTEVQSSISGPSRWSVRLVAWEAGAIEPSPADGLVSPRFFELGAGERQIIRAQIQNRARYHRLLVEQIPDQNPGNQGLAFRFRFSLPIYRDAKEPAPHQPSLPLVAGCHRFENPQPIAVRLVLDPDVKGPQTLLPGEQTELCRSSRTAQR